jgi:hypothetical protein
MALAQEVGSEVAPDETTRTCDDYQVVAHLISPESGPGRPALRR